MLDWLVDMIAADVGATLAGDSQSRVRSIRQMDVIRRLVWTVVLAAIVMTIAALIGHVWLGVAAAVIILFAFVVWMRRTRRDAHWPRG